MCYSYFWQQSPPLPPPKPEAGLLELLLGMLIKLLIPILSALIRLTYRLFPQTLLLRLVQILLRFLVKVLITNQIKTTKMTSICFRIFRWIMPYLILLPWQMVPISQILLFQVARIPLLLPLPTLAKSSLAYPNVLQNVQRILPILFRTAVARACWAFIVLVKSRGLLIMWVYAMWQWFCMIVYWHPFSFSQTIKCAATSRSKDCTGLSQYPHLLQQGHDIFTNLCKAAGVSTPPNVTIITPTYPVIINNGATQHALYPINLALGFITSLAVLEILWRMF